MQRAREHPDLAERRTHLLRHPGCTAEYPTKVCTFNGGHTNIANDPGSSSNWIPTESWKFFTQF